MYIMFLFIFVASLFIDIVTKTLATQLTSSITVIPNFFHLTYVENRGAAWGIGANYQVVFIIVAILFSILLIMGALYINLKYKSLFYSLALLLSGTIGNCLDRILNGYVVDFLDFNILGYAFPVFNIADICIVCSAFIIVLNLFMIKEDDIFEKKKMFSKDV